MQSNFKKIIEFNDLFDVKTYRQTQLDFLKNSNNNDILKLRLDLIKEEHNELIDAVKNKDLSETIDALTDLLYVTYGFFHVLGVDADKAFDIVHKSNMSKVCSSEEEAVETCDYYLKNESDRYKTPNYRIKQDPNGNNYYIVYNKDTNKILKSINYNAVNFNRHLLNIDIEPIGKYTNNDISMSTNYCRNLGIKSVFI